VSLFEWFRRGKYPEVDRRLLERRGHIGKRSIEQELCDYQERQEIDRRLHRIARELDVLRREPT